jgi:hypothetical protein
MENPGYSLVKGIVKITKLNNAPTFYRLILNIPEPLKHSCKQDE